MSNLIYFFAQKLVDPKTISIPQNAASENQITAILRIVFGIIGAISVLMVVLGGFNYVISNGDPQKTAKAKDTILYALIGLAVSILAGVIVTFVIGRIIK